MKKVDKYGMQTGIIKIIPPPEWKRELPDLDELVKRVRVREPIKQDIMGSNGTYRQVNILHQRSYNLPQWRQLCEQSEHQPPARRGERRLNEEKPKGPPKPRPPPKRKAESTPSGPSKRSRGRGRRGGFRGRQKAEDQERPMTPESPRAVKEEEDEDEASNVLASVEDDPGMDPGEDDVNDGEAPVVRRMGFVAQQPKSKTQSTSARRKYARREASAKIDEEAFKDFDYRMDISEFTRERCDELEKIYWKTLTYAPPLYGADLPGTLFDDSTKLWNLNKLPNLLDVLGTKVPGVNTAYLYLGMWKATFAWHLEDVDLYSINYLHFGAPKQWYSISQRDARRFEAAMKSIWPTEAKACDQFLRHKAFLISPQHLLQHYNIKVNKCVSYPGEFVVTYPYGYHSGFNLGYNCAEAVNFALDTWLPMGKIAKKCECAQAQDSVWIDVYEIERKLRGESTDDGESDDELDDEESIVATPTPAAKGKRGGGRRQKAAKEKATKKAKIKLKLKLKEKRKRGRVKPEYVCALCPNDIPGLELLPTTDGRRAHRICAQYVEETYIDLVDGKEVVHGCEGVVRKTRDSKCLYCRNRRVALFNCSHPKCIRMYHATCALPAGFVIEESYVPVYTEDGTEYKQQTFHFLCRFHRTKRPASLDSVALEEQEATMKAAAALKPGQTCQMQYPDGDIFAGTVVENRPDEEMVLIDLLPKGARVEVEWKYLVLPDPADFKLAKASENALPLPTSYKERMAMKLERRGIDEPPVPFATFVDGYSWREFRVYDPSGDNRPPRVDLSQPEKLWYYLPEPSTDTKAEYTDDVDRKVPNPKAEYVPPRPPPPPKPPRIPSLPKVSPLYATPSRLPIARPLVASPFLYHSGASSASSSAVSMTTSSGPAKRRPTYANVVMQRSTPAKPPAPKVQYQCNKVTPVPLPPHIQAQVAAARAQASASAAASPSSPARTQSQAPSQGPNSSNSSSHATSQVPNSSSSPAPSQVPNSGSSPAASQLPNSSSSPAPSQLPSSSSSQAAQALANETLQQNGLSAESIATSKPVSSAPGIPDYHALLAANYGDHHLQGHFNVLPQSLLDVSQANISQDHESGPSPWRFPYQDLKAAGHVATGVPYHIGPFGPAEDHGQHEWHDEDDGNQDKDCGLEEFVDLDHGDEEGPTTEAQDTSLPISSVPQNAAPAAGIPVPPVQPLTDASGRKLAYLAPSNLRPEPRPSQASSLKTLAPLLPRPQPASVEYQPQHQPQHPVRGPTQPTGLPMTLQAGTVPKKQRQDEIQLQWETPKTLRAEDKLLGPPSFFRWGPVETAPTSAPPPPPPPAPAPARPVVIPKKITPVPLPPTAAMYAAMASSQAAKAAASTASQQAKPAATTNGPSPGSGGQTGTQQGSAAGGNAPVPSSTPVPSSDSNALNTESGSVQEANDSNGDATKQSPVAVGQHEQPKLAERYGSGDALPDVEVGSQDMVDRMMANLRRVSGGITVAAVGNSG